MSQLEVDKIIPQSGTTLTIGDSGDTVNFADGTNLSIDTNTLYIDSTNNRVGIANASPSVALDVTGDAKVSGDLTVDTSTLYVDSTNNKVGIGTAFPNNYASSANTLVVGSTSGQNGITIVTSTSETGSLQFADGATGNQSYQGRIRYDHSASTMSFHVNNGSERMRIDSSGNVMVGTTSASGFDSAGLPLIVGSGSTHQGITIFSGTSHQGAIHFADGTGTSSYRGQLNYKHDVDAMTFATSGSEKARLDASGNFMVGTTSNDPAFGTSTGFEAQTSGQTHVSSSSTGLIVNRTASDGTLLQFRKAGTTVGSIGVNGGDNPFFSGSASNHGGVMFSDAGSGQPTMLPVSSGSTLADNSVNIGVSSYRYKDLYLGGGLYVGGTGGANRLDDYEEGTFSPSISGNLGGASGVNFSVRNGFYTKVGRAVFFNIHISLSSWSSGPSGSSTTINGLPFTNENTTGNNASVYIGQCNNFSTSVAPQGGYIQPNETRIILMTNDSSDARNNLNTSINTNTLTGNEEIRISGYYQTA